MLLSRGCEFLPDFIKRPTALRTARWEFGFKKKKVGVDTYFLYFFLYWLPKLTTVPQSRAEVSHLLATELGVHSIQGVGQSGYISVRGCQFLSPRQATAVGFLWIGVKDLHQRPDSSWQWKESAGAAVVTRRNVKLASLNILFATDHTSSRNQGKGSLPHLCPFRSMKRLLAHLWNSLSALKLFRVPERIAQSL